MGGFGPGVVMGAVNPAITVPTDAWLAPGTVLSVFTVPTLFIVFEERTVCEASELI